jgi:hypothetical protein
VQRSNSAHHDPLHHAFMTAEEIASYIRHRFEGYGLAIRISIIVVASCRPGRDASPLSSTPAEGTDGRDPG